jgi:hypothetical protein
MCEADIDACSLEGRERVRTLVLSARMVLQTCVFLEVVSLCVE